MFTVLFSILLLAFAEGGGGPHLETATFNVSISI